MANNFVVPFDNNPASVAVKTSSYTIPAGSYARVIVSNFEADFTIDAVVAVESILFEGTVGTANGTVFTNTSGYRLEGSIGHNAVDTTVSYSVASGSFVSGAASAAKGSASQETSAANMKKTDNVIPCGFVMNPNDTFQQSNQSASVSYYNFTATDAPDTQVFWVPTGTDLDGSRYTVELYTITV